MPFEYSSGAFVYIIQDGKPRLLFLKNNKNDMDIPKGKIEKGESIVDAALREIKEETGLDVSLLPYFREYTRYFFWNGKKRMPKKVYIFIAKAETDKVRISEEHLSYRWMGRDQALAETKFQNMAALLPKAYDYIDRYEKMSALNREYMKVPLRMKKWDLSKRLVPGEGPLNAQVMLVGQAPGRNEDISGRPFVGRSGEALNAYLRKAKIRRERVYVTSVVQFFPPDNRLPTREEVGLCKSFLFRQIEIVKPKSIILLGNLACETLLGSGKVTQMHGKVVEKGGVSYMITFHPAMALRSSKTVAKLIEDDFRNFRKMLG